MHIRRAESDEEQQACKDLIARVYRDAYGVTLTDGTTDPDGGLERFPDRFAMGTVDGRLVATCGLYTSDTYVERYGLVSREALDEALEAAEVSPYDVRGRERPFYEYTKVVVDPAFGKRGFGRQFLAATHSRSFLHGPDGIVPFLLVCARLSVFRLWDAMGLRTRYLRDFPIYRNHARYRSPEDPMESRLVVPERDVAARWFLRPWPTVVWSPSDVDVRPTAGPAVDLRLVTSDLQRRWHRCYLTAEFLAGLVAPHSTRLLMVIDELLENAAKFSCDPEDTVHLRVVHEGPELHVEATNRARRARADDLAALITRLQDGDHEAMFVEHLERSSHAGDMSRLGFLTLCLNAGARLDVRVDERDDDTCDVTVQATIRVDERVAA